VQSVERAWLREEWGTNLKQLMDEDESSKDICKVEGTPVLVEGLVVERVVNGKEVVFWGGSVVCSSHLTTEWRIIVRTGYGSIECLLVGRDAGECCKV
jgi:hypothetical protein